MIFPLRFMCLETHAWRWLVHNPPITRQQVKNYKQSQLIIVITFRELSIKKNNEVKIFGKLLKCSTFYSLQSIQLTSYPNSCTLKSPPVFNSWTQGMLHNCPDKYLPTLREISLSQSSLTDKRISSLWWSSWQRFWALLLFSCGRIKDVFDSL